MVAQDRHGVKSIDLGIFSPTARDELLCLQVRLDPEDCAYDYSKLYFSTAPDEAYAEERVICFRVRARNAFEQVGLPLPPRCLQTGFLRMRLDGLPYSAGTTSVAAVKLLEARPDDELTRHARLVGQKEWVRKEVERSEGERRTRLGHYPESLSLELTPRCNLTCSHCSSHGTGEVHQLNNRRKELDLGMLERLAHEVFPHLTLLTLVGRGEPTMVSDRLWARLTELLEYYRVFLSCVTNGYFIRRRIDAAVLALIDTLTISIDGVTADIFAANRGGASLDRVLANVAYFHDLRSKAGLARRPKLGLSWTLKRNNIAEFPDFVRLAKRFDPDFLYVRHLLVFHEKDRGQSLLGHADLANRYLGEAYAMLRGSRIKLDVPPLMSR